MTQTLLLVQPLKLDDININIFDEEEEEETEQQIEQPSIDKIIDDAELLAILGLSTPPPLDSNSLLDWEDMPELSESEEEEEHINNKRKFVDDEEQDIFAQFDFEEAHFLYTNPNKKSKIEFIDSSVDNKNIISIL